MSNIIIAPDSFKGSVNATEIARCITQVLQQELDHPTIWEFPIADGGEGTIKALEQKLNLERNNCLCHDARMRPTDAYYGIERTSRTAYIEMAMAAGLPQLAYDERNPLETTTYGVGEMILDAVRKGCRHIVIGLGGSATNDAGTGMMEALGMRFLDSDGLPLHGCGANLEKICRIDSSQLIPELEQCTFTAACDVTNPFTGPEGAAYTYAPQKGATPEQVRMLEHGMQEFQQVIRRETGTDLSNLAGAGAAGGLGGGIAAFLQGKLTSGISLILDSMQFDRYLQQADLVISGEGKFDGQTTYGKAIQGIAERCRKAGKPLVVLAGAVEGECRPQEAGVTAVFPIQPAPVSLEKAMEHDFTLRNIQCTVRQIISLLKSGISVS